ncbi:MAG: FAD-dependent oxidoreductase [Pseudomonadota bacterium]
MANKADVLIVGAGVAGLCTAFWLHEAGYSIKLFDAGAVGQESSWAGGGIISAVPPWAYPESINQGIARSRDLYPQLIERLQSETGIDCEYQQCGLLLCDWPEDNAQRWLVKNGITAQYASRAEFESALNHPDTPAILLPEVSQLRSPRFVRVLHQWLLQAGVEIIAHTPIESILHRRRSITGIRLSNGTSVHADQVVLAAGAWTDRLLARSGLNGFGIQPMRGQMLLYRAEPGLIRHIVNTPGGYLIPRRDGRILAGSTVEPVGFDRRPSSSGFEQLRRMAELLLPELRPDRIELHWAGLRPSIAGDKPLCGPYAEIKGLWLQSGGFRNGLGLAPANAKSLTKQIVNSDTKKVKM